MTDVEVPTEPIEIPAGADLPTLTEAARGCRGCELYAPADQTVFGEGPVDARILFVGEQPGDQEDRAGRPFVGPAGKLLDRALEQAGIDREITYVTNAVKHFRFRPAGKRRIHATPDTRHVTACRPWLDAELALVDPEIVVCLGATAAKGMLGSSFRITKQRGQLFPFDSPNEAEDAAVKTAWVMATIHPSAILRTPDDERPAAFDALVADLRIAADTLR